MSQADLHRQALQARQNVGGIGQRPTVAHHGALLRGVIVGPITPQMRAAQIYTVHLEGAVRAVLRNVPLAAPAGGVSYNGATYLAHLSEGDHVLVGFNNTTHKPVILCSLCTNEYPGKVDNETNRRTIQDNYVQPPGSAYKDFLPSWLYLGQVFGQIIPYDALKLEENQTNPDTTAGTRVPGVFNLYTSTGDRLEYTPGVTYRMSVGPVLNHIPGIGKKMVEYANNLANQAIETGEKLATSATGGGTGAYPDIAQSGTRLGIYEQNPEPAASRLSLAQQILQAQEIHAQRIQQQAENQEQRWQVRVLQPLQQVYEQWQPQGTLGLRVLEEEQPFTLGKALAGRVVPVVGEEGSSELETILQVAHPVITHSDDPRAQGGRRTNDLSAVVRQGVTLLRFAQSFAERLSNAFRSQKDARKSSNDKPKANVLEQNPAAVELAVLLDRFDVPTAPEFVATLPNLLNRPNNLLNLLDTYFWMGDLRVSTAMAALIVKLDDSQLKTVSQNLKELWQYADDSRSVPQYIEDLLQAIALGSDAAFEELFSILELSLPDLEALVEDYANLGDWLGQVDERFSEMGQAWKEGRVVDALLLVLSYSKGVDWQVAPNELQFIRSQLEDLIRGYQWQSL